MQLLSICGLGVPLLPLAQQVGPVAPVRPTLGVWFVAPCPSAAHGVCARCPGPLGACLSVRAVCVACTCRGVLAWCAALCVQCPGPLGSCSRVCTLAVLCCVCDVLGHLAPVHGCARSVCCVACAVSWATWLLVTSVHPRCYVLRVRCPGPVGPCSPMCTRGVLCCVCCVLGHLAPGYRCVRSVCCVACAVSWATWLLFSGLHARCVVLCVRCPEPLGASSPVCTVGLLCCVCGVLGHLAPVQRCARWMCCGVRALSLASWLLFTGLPARCVV